MDLALTRAKLAVFVDGCFWHGCEDHCVTPKTNTEWWLRMKDRAYFAWTSEVGLRYRWHTETRPGVRSQSRLATRKQIAARHAPGADKATRSRLFYRVSAAALLADHRFEALAWALRAYASQPSKIALKLIGRAALGTLSANRPQNTEGPTRR